MAKLVALLLAVSCALGCDAFGDVRCADDDDCPASLPFCASGSCAEVDDEDRAPTSCTSDADCGRALCYDLDDGSGETGRCVPSEDLVDGCATAQEEPTTSRDDEGPALVSLTVGPSLGGCSPSYSLVFRYFDREGDMPDPSEFIAVLFVRAAAGEFASSSALVGSTVTGDDPAQAALIEYEACDDAPLEPVAAWLEDSAGNRSNVVCAAP